MNYKPLIQPKAEYGTNADPDFVQAVAEAVEKELNRRGVWTPVSSSGRGGVDDATIKAWAQMPESFRAKRGMSGSPDGRPVVNITDPWGRPEHARVTYHDDGSQTITPTVGGGYEPDAGYPDAWRDVGWRRAVMIARSRIESALQPVFTPDSTEQPSPHGKITY
jgi:hypothetical protein